MTSQENSSEIQINVKGPNELKLQITINTDKTVLDLKQVIADQSDVEADRQRLIYAGRVLKNDDALSVYKIQSSHTIHMVKGAARSGDSSSQQSTTPQPLPTMQAGQNPHDPLTQLNSHQGFGAMAGLNPFADMGLNSNDPNLMATMLNSPQFLQQMSTILSNPAVLDQIIASNPQLAAMEPQVREIFQSEHFRQMMSNPESLRTMLQMSAMFRDPSQFGGNPGGFPAPGVPSTGVPPTANPPPAQTPPVSPFGFLFPPSVGATPAGGVPPAAPPNAALLQQLFGGAALGGQFGAAPAAATTDTRSPEERFEVQLRQLQEMGFTNAAQNVRSLQATAGNVQLAIEYILNGGGL